MLQKVNEQNEQEIIKRPLAKLQRGDGAKIMAQGNFFKIWQWPQKLYDGSEVTFESISRADTVTVLALTACVTKNGVPHRHGDFCPPGQAKKGNC